MTAFVLVDAIIKSSDCARRHEGFPAWVIPMQQTRHVSILMGEYHLLRTEPHHVSTYDHRLGKVIGSPCTSEESVIGSLYAVVDVPNDLHVGRHPVHQFQIGFVVYRSRRRCEGRDLTFELESDLAAVGVFLQEIRRERKDLRDVVRRHPTFQGLVNTDRQRVYCQFLREGRIDPCEETKQQYYMAFAHLASSVLVQFFLQVVGHR